MTGGLWEPWELALQLESHVQAQLALRREGAQGEHLLGLAFPCESGESQTLHSLSRPVFRPFRRTPVVTPVLRSDTNKCLRS